MPPRTPAFEVPSAEDVGRGAAQGSCALYRALERGGRCCCGKPALFLPSVSVSPLLPPTEIPPGERQPWGSCVPGTGYFCDPPPHPTMICPEVSRTEGERKEGLQRTRNPLGSEGLEPLSELQADRTREWFRVGPGHPRKGPHVISWERSPRLTQARPAWVPIPTVGREPCVRHPKAPRPRERPGRRCGMQRGHRAGGRDPGSSCRLCGLGSVTSPGPISSSLILHGAFIPAWLGEQDAKHKLPHKPWGSLGGVG